MVRMAVVIGIVLCLAGTVPFAAADSIKWSFNDLKFQDGGTASGSFVYDATTNTVTSVEIVTTAGTEFGGASYTAVDPNFGPFASQIGFVTLPGLANYLGTTGIEIETDSPLTNAGGNVTFDINELYCANRACSAGVFPELRGTFTGTLQGVTSTPEASSLVLLAFGLFAFLVVGRLTS